MAGNPLNHQEYLKAKRSLKAHNGNVSAVANELGRSETIIRGIKRTASWPKYQEMVKQYRKARTERFSKLVNGRTKVGVVEVPVKAIVSVQTDKPLLDTLHKPERRSKKQSKEVLSLRTEVETLKRQLTATEKQRDRYRDDVKTYRGEAIRLGKKLAEAKRPLWKKIMNRQRTV